MVRKIVGNIQQIYQFITARIWTPYLYEWIRFPIISLIKTEALAAHSFDNLHF